MFCLKFFEDEIVKSDRSENALCKTSFSTRSVPGASFSNKHQ